MPAAAPATDWMLLHGSPEPPPARLTLRAGPLTLEFEPDLAFLRYIRLGREEVLRGLYCAVRERDWNTVLPQVSNLQVEQGEGSFRLAFDVACTQGEIDFRWRGTVTGDAAGTLVYRMEGEALTTFHTARIGFCVLHPDRECAGKPCLVEHTDGTREHGAFPDAISPHQPFFDIRALSHEVGPGVTAEVRMEGDTWEMEDQRNWTDSSYKTYSRPLALPWPYEVAAGTRIEQSVTLTLSGLPTGEPSASRTADDEVELTIGDTAVGVIPKIGLALGSGPALSPSEIARLKALHLSHVRVDLHLSDPGYPEALEAAFALAWRLDAGVEAAVFIPENAEPELRRLATLGRRRIPGPKELTWLVFPERGLATTEREIDLALRCLGYGRLGGGTNVFFTELNRGRPPADRLQVVCYSVNPQCHAVDDASVVETLRAQATTVESARRLYPGKEIHVSPVTLKARFNPHNPIPIDDSGDDPPPSVDTRQRSLFGASWTLGSLKYLAEAGAASVTLYEATGWRGVMERESGPLLPEKFPSRPGELFPLYHVLRGIAGYQGLDVHTTTSSHPFQVDALTVQQDEETFVWVANFTAEPRRVRICGLAPGAVARYWTLDEACLSASPRSPDALHEEGATPLQIPTEGVTLELPRFAVVGIYVDSTAAGAV